MHRPKDIADVSPPSLAWDRGRAARPETGMTSLTQEDRAAVEALAVSWSQPPLPNEESPWSEVEPTGPGPGPPSEEREARPAAGPKVVSWADAYPAGPEAAVWPRRISLSLVSLLILFGVLAYAWRSGHTAAFARAGGRFGDLMPHRAGLDRPVAASALASARNLVFLETEPPGGRVVGASDGLELGAAPLEFLMPKGVDARVLVELENRETVAVSLPSSGRVIVRLPAIEGGVSGSDPTSGKRERPLSNAQPRPRHPVRIVGPVGARVRADGVDLGTVPVELFTSASFVRVEAARLGAIIGRWVPVNGPTEVDLELEPKGGSRASAAPSASRPRRAASPTQ